MEVDIAMNGVKYKKTFWMNFVLSIFFFLCSAFYFFLNIDYVEARLLDKIFNLTLVVTPLFTLITLYKNDSNLLSNLALALNILLSLTLMGLLIRAIRNHSIETMIGMFLFLMPFLFNVKQLIKIRYARHV